MRSPSSSSRRSAELRQPDDGRRSERDQRRARPGGRDLPARDPRRRRQRLGASTCSARAPHATSTTFLIDERGLPPVQLVPSAVRRADGPRDRRARWTDTGDGESESAASATAAGEDGRRRAASPSTRRWRGSRCACGPSSAAPSCRSAARIELPLGAVVDLDCAADSPVDIFVNGLRFAQGQLLVTDDGEWAVSLEALRGQDSPAAPEIDAHPQLKGAVT